MGISPRGPFFRATFWVVWAPQGGFLWAFFLPFFEGEPGAKRVAFPRGGVSLPLSHLIGASYRSPWRAFRHSTSVGVGASPNRARKKWGWVCTNPGYYRGSHQVS